MSLLSGRKAFTALETGRVYKAIMQGYTETASTEPTERLLGFASFKFLLEDDGRTITDTRSVPQGTDILARQILEQADNPEQLNGIDQEELFKACIKNQTVFDMWVTHRTVDGQTYTNYTFKEPAPEPTLTLGAMDVDTEDFV